MTDRIYLIHTASLYYWFDDYETHLDDRIHAALDAGLDGVEISNGQTILTWQPAPETIKRLKDKVVALHAETGPNFNCTLDEWAEGVSRLPFKIYNAVFHPDELTPEEIERLASLPFPVSLENLDTRAPDWETVEQINRVRKQGVGFTYDTAHAEETQKTISADSISPVETHLSIPNDGDYYNHWGWQTNHAMTQFRNDFPSVPSSCPVITLEGLVPPDLDVLKDELEYIKWNLGEA